MPSGPEIQQYLTGAWRLMLGRPEGIRLLDVSVDGFWNSFFAIVVALPALMVGWVAAANEMAGLMTLGMRLSLLLRLFVADIGAWVLPLVFLAVASKPLGVADRFVYYVVATNWASALLAWMMLPSTLLYLFMPEATNLIAILSLVLFVLIMFLSWRVTVMAIAKGTMLGSVVFFAVLAMSIATLLALQSLLRINVGF